jgi:UDP-N-acetyl-D-glucosamine dehydrogenase
MRSVSPFNDVYDYELDDTGEVDRINSFVSATRKTVVIQGLGFVGAAMLAAVASAKDRENKYLYNVIGVDLADEANFWKIAMVNGHKPPIVSTDLKINDLYDEQRHSGNVLATYSDYAYSVADIVIVDIHLDINKKSLGEVKDYGFSYDSFCAALGKVAAQVREGTLIIIETTVPPGTTDKIVYPLFQKAFLQRGLDPEQIFVAHSYERVMPGNKYLDSIINYYRVFSGVNEESRSLARSFLETVINVEDYPLSELRSTNASEMAKVLENSYRACNIAFIQEWTEFAQASGVDLFEVIAAIRKRPTHANIMQPGFGVGGYCLTKDALLADWAFINNFGSNEHLEFSLNSVQVNDLMPEYTHRLILDDLGSLSGRTIAVLGVSYLNDVSDTRNTPVDLFYQLCIVDGARIVLHDPLVSYWKERDLRVIQEFDAFREENVTIVVLTVRHKEYLDLSVESILSIFPRLELLVDANNVISDDKASAIKSHGIKVIGVGKGHWK